MLLTEISQAGRFDILSTISNTGPRERELRAAHTRNLSGIVPFIALLDTRKYRIPIRARTKQTRF